MNIHAIQSKADYISALAIDIYANHEGKPYTITEQATFQDIYRQLCNIADTLDEMAPTWGDEEEEDT